MRGRNRSTIGGVATGVLLLAVSGGCKKEPVTGTGGAVGKGGRGPTRNPAAVVVSVGRATLTEGELASRVDRLIAAQGLEGLPETQMEAIRTQVRRNVIDAFVGQTVLEQEADRLGVTVTTEEVDRRLAEITQRVPEGRTLEEILSEVGTTPAQFRADLTRDLRIRKLIDEQVHVDAVTEEEIGTFYEQAKDQLATPEMVQARHILIACDAGADEGAESAAKQQAESVRQRLLDGEDFGELARAASACPSKAKGGDLGSFPRGQMVKEFEEAAFSQKVNEIGPPIRTQFGYHIIQVTGHTEAGVRPLAELKQDIEAYLTRNRKQQATTQYVSNLLKNAEVKYGE